jgi:aspartate 1-decarboxylase
LFRKFLRAKIHRATVTGADLDYEGSIAIDTQLLEAANIASFESVHIWNVSNGERFETYAIPAKAGSGEIMLNGAAARRVQVGDKVIVAAFSWLDQTEFTEQKPALVFVDEKNRILKEAESQGHPHS